MNGVGFVLIASQETVERILLFLFSLLGQWFYNGFAIFLIVMKIYFMESIWRSNNQNYSLALEMLNGDNMQGNASGVKCEMQNGVSTSSAFNKI